MEPLFVKPVVPFSEKLSCIAGAIMAENSLNVQTSDAIQDFLLKLKLEKSAEKLFGRKFTFGWGQLSTTVAMKAEPLAARIEGRAQRDSDTVAQELLKPASAIRYVAAVLRGVQDTYRAEGMDISKDPAILATVYNLGHEERRAKESKAAGRAPRVNYFGFFVRTYMNDVQKALGTAAPKSQAPVQAVAANVPARLSPAVPPATKAVAAPVRLENALVAQEDLVLYAAPPHCNANGAGNQGSFQQFKSKTYHSVQGTLPKRSRVSVVAPGLGCGLDEWAMVRDENGTTGWLKKDRFEAATRKEMVPVLRCATQSSPNCGKAIDALDEAERIPGPRGKSGELSYKLLGGKADFSIKKPQPDCYVAKKQRMRKNEKLLDSITAAPSAPPKPAALSPDEIRAALAKIDEKKANILVLLNRARKEDGLPPLKEWQHPENPYALLMGPFLMATPQLTRCVESDSIYLCEGDLNAFLKTFDFEPVARPGYQLLKKLSTGGGGFENFGGFFSYPDPEKSASAEYKQKWKQELLKRLRVCTLVAENLPQSSKRLLELQKKVEENPLTRDFETDSLFSVLEGNCQRLLALYYPQSASSRPLIKSPDRRNFG
ncbi:MAG: DUF1402 family protein [Oligoflexia bacterium]|nr:DUF1402 family protein [Oligoflexia bacterium]